MHSTCTAWYWYLKVRYWYLYWYLVHWYWYWYWYLFVEYLIQDWALPSFRAPHCPPPGKMLRAPTLPPALIIEMLCECKLAPYLTVTHRAIVIGSMQWWGFCRDGTWCQGSHCW